MFALAHRRFEAARVAIVEGIDDQTLDPALDGWRLEPEGDAR